MRRERYEDDDPPPRREKPSGDLRQATWGATTAAARRRGEAEGEGGEWRPELPEIRTAGQRKRFRRNLIVALAHEAGLSSRFIADALELSKSQVNEAIEQMGKFRPA